MTEKIFIPNSREETLVGILNNGRVHSPILLFVHGFAGNKDENGLFVQAEDYFSSKGFNTFRFDMAGVGESSGDYRETTLKKQAQDLELVITNLRDKYSQNNLSIIGFSLGATASTLINPKLVNQYVFWSPAIFTAKDMFPKYATAEVLDEINSKGYLDKGGVKVGKPIINNLKEYNPELFLKTIHKPVLLVHGSEDPRIDYRSTIAAQKLFSNAKFIKIDGANHSYKNNDAHRSNLFKETYNWLVNEIYKKKI
ncbi:MAG: alpha/beta hydrolase [Candidatus Woesearchaeota archaeon]